jgi:hypothetical protein
MKSYMHEWGLHVYGYAHDKQHLPSGRINKLCIHVSFVDQKYLIMLVSAVSAVELPTKLWRHGLWQVVFICQMSRIWTQP